MKLADICCSHDNCKISLVSHVKKKLNKKRKKNGDCFIKSRYNLEVPLTALLVTLSAWLGTAL